MWCQTWTTVISVPKSVEIWYPALDVSIPVVASEMDYQLLAARFGSHRERRGLSRFVTRVINSSLSATFHRIKSFRDLGVFFDLVSKSPRFVVRLVTRLWYPQQHKKVFYNLLFFVCFCSASLKPIILGSVQKRNDHYSRMSSRPTCLNKLLVQFSTNVSSFAYESLIKQTYCPTWIHICCSITTRPVNLYFDF